MVSGYVQNFKKGEAKDNYKILNWMIGGID